MRPEDLSVIVCTKDRPWHLRLTLLGLAAQEVRPGEVVVADSGGREPAGELVASFTRETGLRTRHVNWRTEDFRIAVTKNAGAAAAGGKWLLFLDDDCLPLPGVVGIHLRSATAAARVLVGGFVRLDPERTRTVTAERIACGGLSGMLLPAELAFLRWRHRKGRMYSLVRHPKRPALTSGHFSVAASAFRAVNGYDESFVGWGGEDDDLRYRLTRWGARVQSIFASAVCLHLWHEPDTSKPKRWREGVNVPYLIRKDRPVRCTNGLVKRS